MIEKYLDSISYRNIRRNKHFYSLKDLLTDTKILGFNSDEMFKCLETVKEKMSKISISSKFGFHYIYKDDKVQEIYLNEDCLMFVLCEMAKNIKEENKKDVAITFAKYLRKSKYLFLPEIRLLERNNYTETTKDFRSELKRFFNINDPYILSSNISLVYHTILSQYYNVSNIEELNYIKNGSKTKNYLDYISAKELKDLTDIQKAIISKINFKNINIFEVARIEARNKRIIFHSNYSGCFPDEYRAHHNKPLKMYKDFYKLLQEYHLDAKSLNLNEIDNLIY